jgi:gluconokinase
MSVTGLVVMGVSGGGKTTVGRMLAARLGWEFLEVDDFHSPKSKAKMAAQIRFDDADRAPSGQPAPSPVRLFRCKYVRAR